MTINHQQMHNFTDALEATRTALGVDGMRGTADADLQLATDLAAVVVADGPAPSSAQSLSQLRTRLASGSDECSAMLAIAGQKPLPDTATIEGVVADKVAALKFLRHLYLATLRDSQQLWIASMPGSYRSWPHRELRFGPPTVTWLRAKANDVSERFSEDDRKNLGTSAQDALRWALDAQIKVSPVAAGTAPVDAPGRVLIKRWFCDENSSDAELTSFARSLNAGFQKIASAANSGRLIFTDHVGYRGTTFEDAEAFVTNGAKRDRPDVVYIENAFFGNNNVLQGRVNWARIVVHELSHREVNAVDVPGHYGWQGIKPSAAGFPAAQAITNAENWAFFAADCAGALTDDQRNEALQ